ncbi:MAG: cbb3-type cytochrome oxidase assembly protein CcoS [Candidatus Karelsulcia muelleri]|uniref:cbb3-type cytochrome oxidase assembly protein CcoS n=1 Tax=Candidatus Karelsulcia muelleri TaxID=336810 RepID=UPI001EF71661|nr:cbb3-type cytochrome oxidase assembly protein CcoS [Candidatus Karelsulcia muelleri]
MILISLIIEIIFLILFFINAINNQFEDYESNSIRILIDENEGGRKRRKEREREREREGKMV